MVFSIAASIASIVAHWRIRRVERMLNVTTHGASSPVYIAGGDLNVLSMTENVTNTIQSNIVMAQPPTTPPPTTTSP
jgi:hypothetical protein